MDTRSLKGGPAGVATYVRNLLKELPFLQAIDYRFPSNNFLWNQFWGPVGQIRCRWHVFHAPSYTAPLLNLARLILSVHDVSYLVHPDWYPHQLGSLRLTYYRASLKRADRIITPSEFSAREILRLFPALRPRLRCIPLAASPEFYPDESGIEMVRRKWNLPPKFLLHVGDLHPRRNPELLVKVAQEVGLPLVLVGKILVKPVSQIDEGIRLENVSLAELRGIYSAATLLLYASVYEGFGLPLLEAMACGLPVVAVDRASIPEVCGGAAPLVQPSLEGLISGVEEVLAKNDFWVDQGRKRVSEFSWQRTAQQTSQVYQEVVANKVEEFKSWKR